MRVLAVRPGSEEVDIARGRTALLGEIQHPSRIVMVIRGQSPAVSQFADRADGRAAPFQWRSVVWVQDSRIFADGQESSLFDDDGWCAVVLDLDDRPAVGLRADASLFDIDRAFWEAEARPE